MRSLAATCQQVRKGGAHKGTLSHDDILQALFLFQVKGSDRKAIRSGLYLWFSEAWLVKHLEEEGWLRWEPCFPTHLMTDWGPRTLWKPSFLWMSINVCRHNTRAILSPVQRAVFSLCPPFLATWKDAFLSPVTGLWRPGKEITSIPGWQAWLGEILTFFSNAQKPVQDFPHGPVLKNTPANAEDMGSDPWFGKIPHAAGQIDLCVATTEPAPPRACVPQKETHHNKSSQHN